MPPKKNAEKEAKELPPRASFIESKDFFADTVVQGRKPLYAIYNRNTGGVTYEETVGKFVPLFTTDALIGFVSFPSSAEEYNSDFELLEEIMVFIKKWSDMEEQYLQLAALYAMFTWCYDEFMEVPYLRILADLGSGKSRLGVQVLGAICYKSFRTIAASTLSPLFRTLDFLGGTMILDEADLGDKSDKSSELVQTLNSGYIKGLPILRSEMAGGGGFNARQFKVFGPKIVISREHFRDDALESRCLAIHLKETKRKDIPFLLDESLEEEGVRLRNKLLLWRFRGYGTRRANIDKSFEQLDVPARMKQLLLLMSGATRDERMIAMLSRVAKTMSAEQADARKETVEGEIVEIMFSFGRGAVISCGDIANEYNADKHLLTDKKTAKSIGWYLRERLHVKTEDIPGDKRRRRGVRLTDEDIETLSKKFGIAPPIPLKPKEQCGDCYLNNCRVHV